MWDVMDCEKQTGIKLTESLAMYPAASVCAIYFAHPKSFYFSVGKVTEEQVIWFEIYYVYVADNSISKLQESHSLYVLYNKMRRFTH